MAISDKEFKTEQKILSKVQSLLGKTLEDLERLKTVLVNSRKRK